MAVTKGSTTGTKKLYSQTPTTGYSNAEGSSYNSNLPTKNINQWNNDLLSKYTKKTDNKGNVSYWKGNDRIWAAKDKAGYYHVSSDQTRLNNIIEGYDNKNANGGATYSYNGNQYVAQPEQQQQQAGAIDRSGIMNEATSYARDLEKIKSYYDTYLPAMMNTGKAAADKQYEANTDAAYKTWVGSTTDAKQNYITDSANKRNELQQARDAYVQSRDQVGKESFNTIQQGRENAALRGLTNSGLMQAIDQNTLNQANQARAQIDAQYNQNVAKLNNELSTLVQTYGLGKKEADDIYNNTMQSLEAQRQDEYVRVMNEAQQKAIEYQFGVDSFNAKAYNDASAQLANLAVDTWKTKVDNETDYAIADLQAKNQMSIAQMQDATDRYIANADNATKKWLAQYDRKTQMIITNLSGDIQKELAHINGKYGVAASSAAASIAASADRYNMKVTSLLTGLGDIADKNGWDESTYSGALAYVANGDTGGFAKYVSDNSSKSPVSSNLLKQLGGVPLYTSGGTIKTNTSSNNNKYIYK